MIFFAPVAPANFFKLFLGLFIMLILPVSTFGSSHSPVSPLNTIEPVIQLVADVNLQDCTYTQSLSANQSITIVCDITNKLGNQGDIRYGVRLTKGEGDTQELIDTKVYTQALSLKTNQTIKHSIEYTPPGYLQGEYGLFGFLQTSDGLPLASNFLGKIILKATIPSYLEIKSNTCSLHIQGEPKTTTYAMQQGVDIDQNEVIEGTCVVEAHTTGDTTITPSFVTYQKSVFGEIVSDTKETQKQFSFKKNETKTVSFTLPKASVPQSYDAVFSLISSDGKVVSNEVPIHYVLRGPSATIRNVLLDKDYYTAGDTAHVSVFWTGSADSFFGARKPPTNTTAQNLVISIKDANNAPCSKETRFVIPANESERNAMADYSLPITNLCANPQVMTQIVDAIDAVLAQKTIGFTSDSVQGYVAPKEEIAFKQNFMLYGLFAVLLTIISVFGGIMFIKNRNKVI
ncbi:MAG: hypothetical protein AAB362_01130 [Patescibacteria group bacterium]